MNLAHSALAGPTASGMKAVLQNNYVLKVTERCNEMNSVQLEYLQLRGLGVIGSNYTR